jgi:hypothetical protein
MLGLALRLPIRKFIDYPAHWASILQTCSFRLGSTRSMYSMRRDLFSIIEGPCKRYAETPTCMPGYECLPGPPAATFLGEAAMLDLGCSALTKLISLPTLHSGCSRQRLDFASTLSQFSSLSRSDGHGHGRMPPWHGHSHGHRHGHVHGHGHGHGHGVIVMVAVMQVVIMFSTFSL